MKRMKKIPIWIIALLAMTVTNYAWADDTQDPTPGGYLVTRIKFDIVRYPVAISPTEIAVKWNPGTDNVTPQNKLRYRVAWKKKSSNDWQSSHGNDNPSVNMTSYTITGLQPNTEYIVDVQVWDEANNRIYYGERTVKTDADTEYPKPGTLTVGTVTANSIALSWTKGTDNVTPQNKLKYRVLWKKSSGGAWQVSHGNDNLQVNMTSYTITDLQPNTEYDVNVVVRDEAGNGVFYGERTVKTDADTEYPMPGTLTVGTVTANSIALSWTRGSDNITPQSKLKYRVLWKKSSGGSWQVSHGNYNYQVNMTSYTITGLEANTEYIVNVAVRDEADNGVFYGEKTIKTEADTENPKPGVLTVGMVTTNSIALSWTRGTDNVTPQNKLRYRVVWKKLSGGSWMSSHDFDNPSVNMTSYMITGLEPNTEYTVDVQVCDEAGNRK